MIRADIGEISTRIPCTRNRLANSQAPDVEISHSKSLISTSERIPAMKLIIEMLVKHIILFKVMLEVPNVIISEMLSSGKETSQSYNRSVLSDHLPNNSKLRSQLACLDLLVDW